MVQPVPREKQGYVDHCPLRIKALAAESIEVVFGEQAADLDRFDVIYDCATNSGGGENYKEQALRCLKRPGGQYVAINGALGMWLRLFSGWGQKQNEHLFLTNVNTADLEHLSSLVDTPGTSCDAPTAVRPYVCRLMPFSDAGVEEGFTLLKSRRTVGKIVFEITRAGRDGPEQM